MKRRAIWVIFSICLLLGIILTGCSSNTFKTIVDSELFEDVPLMTGETISFSEVEDVGGGNYLIWAYDTNIDEYKAYLKVLEENKFVKYVDNGEQGLEDFVYTAHYQKDELLVVVTHYPRLKDTMISVCKDAALSEHLIYSDEYLKDNISGAKTSFIMPELKDTGNSFVIQLKNGHYIINDGGTQQNLPYLLDYLESNAPNNEKPIVDAWIVSHSHVDHMGVLIGLMEQKEWAERILVEGIYFTEANEVSHEERRGTGSVAAMTYFVKGASTVFKTSEGKEPQLYRMREGERYYFNDITMDVVYTQDMLTYKEWTTWNATSTVVMYTIEGQKVFITADTDYECQMVMLDVFPDSYFDLTVYQAPHHGGNIYDQFTRHIQVGTVLKPGLGYNGSASALLSRYAQQEYLLSQAEESLSYKEGGLILTFPYEAGTYKRIPPIDWTIYEDEINLLKQ